MINGAEERWQSALELRKSQGLYRDLKDNSHLVDFSSNDYLGLARNEELVARIEEKCRLARIRNKLGSTGSRLITGSHSYFKQTEEQIAAIHEAESALIFNSGYTANLGVFSALPQKGDTVLYDELSHASIKDGIRLGLADRFPFLHNDMDSLESKLRKANGQIFVAVESVYSMDGDFAPLKELVVLCQKYHAVLVVDEAHSTGIFGEAGAGLVCSLGLQEQIGVRVHTFGKAMGCHGAAVVGSKSLAPYLINFARPFIYTTSMSLHSVISISEAYHFLAKEGKQLQEGLRNNIQLLNQLLEATHSKITSESAIHAFLVPGNENVRRVASELQTGGFDLRPIVSPTVKKGAERLRICLHAYNTEAEIKTLCDLLGRA